MVRFTNLIFWGVLLLIAAYCGITLSTSKHQFDADIVATLPGFDQPIIAQADDNFSAQLSQRVVLSFAGKNATKAYDKAFNDLTAISGIQSEQLPLSMLPELVSLYSQHRFHVLNDALASALASEAGVLQYVSYFWGQTASPFVSLSITSDPLMNVAGFLQHNLSATTALTLENNRVVLQSPTGSRYFIFATLNSEQEQQAIEKLTHAIAQWHQLYPNTDVRYSGAPFHNAENMQLAKSETTLFGTVSLLGLAMLVWLAFRSIWPLLLTQLSIVVAALWGLASVLLFFPVVHVLSFVFGITLIGIAIDYVFHVMAHPTSHNEPGLKRAITLGFITTLLGYCSFLVSPMAVLPQVACFVIAGLTGAWLFAIGPLGSLLTSHPVHGQQQPLRVTERIQQYGLGLASNKWLVVIVISVASAALYTWRPVEFNNDVRDLSGSSPLLQQNEAFHYRLLSLNEQRFFIVGHDLQALLEHEELAVSTITEFAPHAKVQGLSNWLPSEKKQILNNQVLRQAQNQGAFSSLNQLLATPIKIDKSQALTLADLQQSPLAPLVDLHLYRGTHTWVSWISVQGLNEQDIAAIVPLLPDHVQRYSKLSMLNESLTHFNDIVMRLCLLAVLICIVVIGLSEGIRTALIAIFILANTLALSLWLSNLLLGHLNVFNLLAIMLIIALAADYLIFYARQGRKPQTTFAITLSALSSMLVFGVLIFSDTPALKSCGTTVFFGIVLIYLMTPMTIRMKS